MVVSPRLSGWSILVLSVVLAAVALGLAADPAVAAPAVTATAPSPAGWDVEWVATPATSGPVERLSADQGRVVYLTGGGAVVLYHVQAGTAVTLTDPGVVAGAPFIEGDYVVWSTYSTEGHEGLSLHDLGTGEDRTITSGTVYDEPILRSGRVLWLGGTNERIVLNLYDIASGTNTPLNEGTYGWSFPLLMNDSWVVWREHQEDGRDLLFAYDIAVAAKHSYSAGTNRRMYGLIGDQVVVSRGATPEAPGTVGLALFDLRRETFSAVPGPGESSVAYVAADEDHGRLAWTAVDFGGPYLAIWDLADQSLDRISTPHYSLGPVWIAGDTVLFRGRPEASIFADAPMVLFAYTLGDGTLTELGQLILPSFPFTTDENHAYWIAQVLTDPSPHLPPHWAAELIGSPASSEHLFVAEPPSGPAVPFADVSGTHPYRTAIISLFEQGAVAGYDVPGGAAFRPDQPYLRAQFAKVMVEALGLPVSEDLEAPFWDLGPDDPDSLYPHDYIAAAFKAGIIQGYPGGAFHPWGPVSRAQLVTLVVRAASALRSSLLLAPPGWYDSLLGAFDNTHGASMSIAQYSGLVNGVIGYGRTWSPWLPVTRGEGARVLWNLLCIDLGPGYVAGNGVSVTGVVPLADPTTKGSGPHS